MSLSFQGQCDCKDNVGGLACTECKGGYFNLQSSNTLGCDNCDCNLDGVIGGLRTCDKVTGQCPCKLYVTGRRCTLCKTGFYGLAGSKVFGCTGTHHCLAGLQIQKTWTSHFSDKRRNFGYNTKNASCKF